eukprot:TRINITY_DN1300_c0_g1_i1.p1 TRINITY_DN1300_c0_g1~~TRINITY_DN1300_c0_g1_i1.p1  ORF type:complete len:202 (+),score=50.39 TRINITY_DN1300_c0_g1_i1:190-795(+)
MSKFVVASVLVVVLATSFVKAQDICTDVPPQGELSCAARKANGGCDKAYMVSGGFCDVTCGRCTEPVITDNCSDVTPDGGFTCAERALFGACNKAWLISGDYCQKTCGYCFSSSDCFDITPPYSGTGAAPTCEQREAWSGCTAAFMKKNNYCAKTCGFCGAAVESEDMEIIVGDDVPETTVDAPEMVAESMDTEMMAPSME